MNFHHKVALVTGAASGIGAATAVKFSKEGVRVVLVDKNVEMLNNIAQICSNSLAICADITMENDVNRILRETIGKYEKLDILVNCAGIAKLGHVLDDDVLNVYDEIMKVNLRAIIHLTKLSAPYLIETKGNIINICSNTSFMHSFCSFFPIYSISKAALNTLTICAASEFAIHGVRVNAISPGPVRTNLLQNCNLDLDYDTLEKKTALNRVSNPEEIADLILYLASDKAKGITGSNYIADNGHMLKH